MSGHGTPEEMQKEVDKWFKLSIGTIIIHIIINLLSLSLLLLSYDWSNWFLCCNEFIISLT